MTVPPELISTAPHNFCPLKDSFFLQIFHPLVIFAPRAASRVAHWVQLRSQATEGCPALVQPQM